MTAVAQQLHKSFSRTGEIAANSYRPVKFILGVEGSNNTYIQERPIWHDALGQGTTEVGATSVQDTSQFDMRIAMDVDNKIANCSWEVKGWN